MVKEPFEFRALVEEKTHQVRNNLQLVLILYFAEVEEILDEDHMTNVRHAAVRAETPRKEGEKA